MSAPAVDPTDSERLHSLALSLALTKGGEEELRVRKALMELPDDGRPGLAERHAWSWLGADHTRPIGNPLPFSGTMMDGLMLICGRLDRISTIRKAFSVNEPLTPAPIRALLEASEIERDARMRTHPLRGATPMKPGHGKDPRPELPPILWDSSERIEVWPSFLARMIECMDDGEPPSAALPQCLTFALELRSAGAPRLAGIQAAILGLGDEIRGRALRAYAWAWGGAWADDGSPACAERALAIQEGFERLALGFDYAPILAEEIRRRGSPGWLPAKLAARVQAFEIGAATRLAHAPEAHGAGGPRL